MKNRFLNRLKVTWLTVSTHSEFLWPKNLMHCTSWIPRPNVHGFFKLFSFIPLTEGFLKGMRPSNHSINRGSVRHFSGLKMRFFKGRVTLDPQVSSIHKASVRPFGGLRMSFFKGHETFEWRIQGSRCVTFRHFGGLKKRSLPLR
jgi:hypothetical protein